MINYNLKKIKAVLLDVDGVLSHSTVNMNEEGEPLRTLNIKDGYAIRLACRLGLKIGIITGGQGESVRKRYAYLGVQDIYMNCSHKIETYEVYKDKYKLTDSEIIYMGDDIPDYEIMSRVGCACAPQDAAADIRAISLYVSDRKGGEGCVRDVIEQVLCAQKLWMNEGEAFGW